MKDNPYINDDIRVMNVMEMWKHGELGNRVITLICKALQDQWNENKKLSDRVKELEEQAEYALKDTPAGDTGE